MSQVTGIKRSNSFDASKLHASKRRKTIPQEELHQKTMMGVVPLMSFAPATSTPDINVVNKLRGIIETGLKSQKQIASENGLSQTMMSQYMNGATRVKGWTVTDSLLDTWADNFNSELKVQTDLIEQQKTNDKEAKSLARRFSAPEYIQPSIIKLSNESNLEDNGWVAGSSGDASSFEEDVNFSASWSSEDHSGIYSLINSTEAENMAIYSPNQALGSGTDWTNFELQRVFYQGQPQQYV